LPLWKRLLLAILVPLENIVDVVYHRFIRSERGRGRFLLIPYLGYGGLTGVTVRGRVLRDPTIPDILKTDTRWRNLANTLRRYNTAELPGAVIEGMWRGHTARAITDEEGIFTLNFPQVPADATGWESIALEMVDYPNKARNPAEPQTVRAEGQAFFPHADAQFAVVSDVDDTVLKTDVLSLITMLRNTFLLNALTRETFPGTADFYRALNADMRNPMFYVSSGAWNLYDLLVTFFQTQGIPPGPLMLTEWGITPSMFITPTRHEHKVGTIERLMTAYPALRFILIGDSGEHDPYIYDEVARKHPDRVLAVYIRDVAPLKRARVEALAAPLKAETGIDLIVFTKTADAHAHAHTHGWVSTPPAAESTPGAASA
jgi:phosphatidate phosphatase APP1